MAAAQHGLAPGQGPRTKGRKGAERLEPPATESFSERGENSSTISDPRERRGRDLGQDPTIVPCSIRRNKTILLYLFVIIFLFAIVQLHTVWPEKHGLHKFDRMVPNHKEVTM